MSAEPPRTLGAVTRAVLDLRRLAFVGLWRRPAEAALGGLLTIVAVVLGIAAAVRLATSEPWVIASASTLIGSAVTALCLLGPIAFARDDPQHPRGFVGFGLPRSRLVAALLLTDGAAVTTVPLAIVILGWTIGWALVSGIVAVVLGVLLLVVHVQVLRLSRAVGVLLWSRPGGRAGRVLAGALLLAAAVIVLAPLADPTRTATAVETIRTLGAGRLWSVPDDGGWILVAGLVVAAAVLGAVEVVLVLAQLAGPRPRRTRPAADRVGVFRLAGASPTLGVAARSAVYWARDPRYGGSALVLPFVPVLMIAAAAIGGVPGQIVVLLPVPALLLLLGWATTHNDVAYDSTAVWSHVVSPLRGVQDRIGRALPPLLIGAVIVLIGAPLCGWIEREEGTSIVVFGLSVAALLSAVGVGSAVSARFPYAVPTPGSSAFRSPQTPGSSGGGVQTLSVVGILLLVSPAAVCAGLWVAYGGIWAWYCLGAGAIVGVLALLAGVALGGVAYDRRGPELIAFAVRN